MKVLIGCERSGVVRRAFEARGHTAYSCDLLPSDDNSPHHYQCDVRTLLDRGRWDLAIFHPECTYLSVSGLHWNKRRPDRALQTEVALDFVRTLLDADIDKIALENPISCISTRIRKPDQIIQPWMFGHDASKATCLWLKGLPKLKPTAIVERPVWVKCSDCDDYACKRHDLHTADCECVDLDTWVKYGDDPYKKYYANQTPSGQNKLGPSPTRAAERARTYVGVGAAMALQWGIL